jgi:pimeloyl-ACP methyl ester carboxylesterase
LNLEILGIDCHAEQAGEGEDILLLHGWGCEIALMKPIFDALSKRCRVTALDFPGHGQSAFPPESGYSLSDYAAFTLELIKRLGIAPCGIVAHSFGGRVALKIAAERPETLKKLLITGGAGLRPRRKPGFYLKRAVYSCLRALSRFFPGGEAFRDALRARFGSADYNALRPEMRATFNKVIAEDLRPLLPRVAAETLLVWGENDGETPLYMGKIMEEEIPGAALVVLEGGSHFAYLEQAPRFARIAEAFFFAE